MSESISLGWNCSSATWGVVNNIRTKKENGYKTCPFDEMITNYQGIILCFLDNFQYLCDTDYLEIIQIDKSSQFLNTNGNGDKIIYNKKYNFLFNHESPGHANLHDIQAWTKGINHYVMDNYAEFVQRYNRRIQNMQQLLHSGKFIHFILSRPTTTEDNIHELKNVIKTTYPNLECDFILLDTDKNIFYNHLRLMSIAEDDDEITRLLLHK